MMRLLPKSASWISWTAVPGTTLTRNRVRGTPCAFPLVTRPSSPNMFESADKPGSVVDSHSSGMCVATHLERPTREPCGPHVVPLLGLAPGGVCPATAVTSGAVRSCRTFSPLPVHPRTGPSAVCFLWHFP